jgi:hypothetical protein
MKKYIKSPQIKAWESQFPELANLDRIANHWAKELMTLYPKGIEKNWIKYYCHLIAGKEIFGDSKIWIASNLGIIAPDIDMALNTLIFVSNDINHATIFYWGHRYNKLSWYYLEKIDKDSFLLKGSDWEKIIKYRKFQKFEFIYQADCYRGNKLIAKKGEKGFYSELYAFINQNLVASMVHNNSSIAGSKGAKVSNSNSATQSKRSKGKIRQGKAVKLVFYNDFVKTDIKNFVEAYKIVAKYYKKSIRSFRNDLHKGELIVHCGLYTVYLTYIDPGGV